jgi:hypothetical protein
MSGTFIAIEFLFEESLATQVPFECQRRIVEKSVAEGVTQQ